MNAHAITPTASDPPATGTYARALGAFQRRGAAAPSPVSSEPEAAIRNERLFDAAQFQGTLNAINALAFQLADESARSDIEVYCVEERDQHGASWYDTRKVIDGFDRRFIDRALQYLDLRGGMRRHSKKPHLVTFAGVE